MIEPAQVVELVVGPAGIDAVMLPDFARNDASPEVLRVRFFAVLQLIRGTKVRDQVLCRDWGVLVIATPGFVALHRSALTRVRPAPQHRIFFARE